jgi:hypothetical protein
MLRPPQVNFHQKLTKNSQKAARMAKNGPKYQILVKWPKFSMNFEKCKSATIELIAPSEYMLRPPQVNFHQKLTKTARKAARMAKNGQKYQILVKWPKFSMNFEKCK